MLFWITVSWSFRSGLFTAYWLSEPVQENKETRNTFESLVDKKRASTISSQAQRIKIKTEVL